MTEANLDLQPSLPSYQSHEQVYCLLSSARSVHNFTKNQIHTRSYAWYSLICHQVSQGMYTILGKASYKLIRLVKAPFGFPHTYCNSAYNSRNKQPDTD